MLQPSQSVRSLEHQRGDVNDAAVKYDKCLLYDMFSVDTTAISPVTVVHAVLWKPRIIFQGREIVFSNPASQRRVSIA